MQLLNQFEFSYQEAILMGYNDYLVNLYSGNEAIIEGAVKVGARFFAGYPITPASSIMEGWARRKDLIFLQSEDEIAAIHHVIGAVLTGTSAFTATSGPGFSLMQEGLGLAFVYEAPIVVINVQRSGPSTGQPTRVGQGEILASRFGTHGDILPFVFYPTSVEECYIYTIKAFEIAWEHKVPVIILTDAYLANMRENVKCQMSNVKSASKISKLETHFTGLTDRQNISKKIAEIKKIAKKSHRFYNLWGNKESDVLLIGTGSMVRALRAFEKDYQIFAPIRIWPFLADDIRKIAKNKKRVVVVEMNEGQYVREVERVLGEKVKFVGWKEETINLKRLKFLISN